MGKRKKETMEAKTLKTQEASKVTHLSEAQISEWGSSGNISAKDIVIPRIQVMQAMSKKLDEWNARSGEFRDSSTGEKLGSIKEPLVVIPFYTQKVWYVKHDGEFSHVEPVTPENENNPWTETVGTMMVERVYTIIVYVLLERDLKSGVAFPYIMSFSKTSLQAGKNILTTMYVRNKQAGKPPAYMAIEVSGTMQENDKGKYVVLASKPARPTTQDELTHAFSWYKTVSQSQANVKLDDDFSEDTHVSTKDIDSAKF